MRNLSIILPHYQKQTVLKKVIDELRLQIHQQDQILVVDDHSPDGVPDFNCPCVEVIKPPKHVPHIYRLNTLRNLGIKNARHEFCIIIDPDCVPNPRFLDNARRMCDASILFTGCIDKVQEDGTIKPDGRRRKSGDNRWIDYKDDSGGYVFGGCMMFSKSRARLVGWFDTEFDGAWGAEETEFAAKCYHSGMRLRYSTGLQVLHLYHEENEWKHGYPRNRKLWKDKVHRNRTHLPIFTPYRPAVGVMVITMMRPTLIDQCMQSIFRNRMPLKVRLINNGDDGADTRRIVKQWGNRWSVDAVYHERKWPAEVRNDSMRWARKHKFKYLIFVDDDMIVDGNGLVNLVKAIEANPEYYALSGYLRKLTYTSKAEQNIGGVLKDNAFWNYPRVKGVKESDWVGGGFTIHKLKPVVPYDEEYQTGYNDFDWSMTCKSQGLKLGVTGDAGSHHGYIFTADGLQRYVNPPEYAEIRYDGERHTRMRNLFKRKHGFEIQKGGLLK